MTIAAAVWILFRHECGNLAFTSSVGLFLRMCEAYMPPTASYGMCSWAVTQMMLMLKHSAAQRHVEYKVGVNVCMYMVHANERWH